MTDGPAIKKKRHSKRPDEIEFDKEGLLNEVNSIAHGEKVCRVKYQVVWIIQFLKDISNQNTLSENMPLFFNVLNALYLVVSVEFFSARTKTKII